MSNTNPDPSIESMVEHRLEELKSVPARNPLRAASGRSRFLSEAAEYEQAIAPITGVRQSGWNFPFRGKKFVANALVTLILLGTLFLGGGATLAAAQDDLPTQPLYQLKLWTEDATLAFNNDPQEQAELLINMAETRVEEMAALSAMGITPPDQVRERLEKQLQQTLLLAADMDEASREQVLLKLRDRLQTQASEKNEPLMSETRQVLQTNLQLVDEGLTDPQGFRFKVKNQVKTGRDKGVDPEPDQNGPNGQPAGEPGNGNGNDTPDNPNPDKPHNGNGGQNPNNPKAGNCSGNNCEGENGGGGNK